MSTERKDFLRDIIDADLAAGRVPGRRVATRFPPEPNGYLHIGHAKSICLNFGLARDYGGTCNLRYDDTNPTKEDVEYVTSIEADVRWLGFAPTEVLYASDTFGRMYDLAVKLVQDGKAYVCSLNEEEIRAYRGTLSEPGRPCPGRARSIEDNLDLFARMRAGEFPDGAHVLRARIDLAAANMKMRDPLLYRIRHAHHHRTGDAWCIYPMYDYAHPLEDAFEAITHSICTLEFENNRELYDWVIEHTGAGQANGPRQYEFARLNIDYTVMSKRKLLDLVTRGLVSGWDDPRMPTIAGMRRRGYRPEAIRAFCDLIGVAKNNSVVDLGKLEFCVRDDLNKSAPRAMAVLRPLRVVVSNAAEGEPRELAIERDDFQVEPEKGFLRLAPGRVVRLRHGGCVVCDGVVHAADGSVREVHVRVLPETRGGGDPAGEVKVWGVLHWVALADAATAEVRLYDRLFAVPRPDEDGDFVQHLNPRSLEVLTGCLVDRALANAEVGSRWQFERLGYFAVDPVDSRPGKLVWNRIVGLRETVVTAAAGAADKGADRKAKDKDKDKDKAGSAQETGPDDKATVKLRPPKRSKAEFRAEARVRDAELAAAFARLQGLGLSADEADLLTGERATAALFEAAVAAGGKPAALARLIINELPRALGDREVAALRFGGAELAELCDMIDAGTVSGAVAKDVLSRMVESGGQPRELVVGLTQVSDDGALESLVEAALAANAGKVAEYKAGKTGLIGFFVGAVVKASGGRANAQKVKELLTKRLG
ncbi:MAG: glutamine--tRNA ligase [Deltaproteobacteria bacterium]|nr:glutamine--tRNA ligase [Deltaproteobacteria bacterium]